MKKKGLNSSARLFDEPVVYESKKPRKLQISTLVKNADGSSTVGVVCVEDVSAKVSSLDFDEIKLQNLIDKGVELHALDMIDTNKIGVDAGVDALANHIINNSSAYVESSKSE